VTDDRAELAGRAVRQQTRTPECSGLPNAWVAKRAGGRSTGNVAKVKPVRRQRNGKPGGWLTTVGAHVCLDMRRSRTSRREDFCDDSAMENEVGVDERDDPEQQLLLADSIGTAMLTVPDRLSPGERVAFVLHDMFGMSFEDIAAILGRSATAARQLASHGRRRVQGVPAGPAEADRKRKIAAAVLAASRNGDFDALLALLDPDVVLRADNSAVRAGATAEVQGGRRWQRRSRDGRAQRGWRWPTERWARHGLRADRRELFLCLPLRGGKPERLLPSNLQLLED
jgi:DNA-directed RNA polymerase specialized sigma24 family protein